jgi:hypothetical protein
MEKKKETVRNRPTEEGRNNDPMTRDDSAIQPGVQTISSSEYDEENQELTDTALGNVSKEKDENAQPRYDE